MDNHRALVGLQALSVLMDGEVKKLLLNFFSNSSITPNSPAFGLKKRFYQSFISFFYQFFSVYEHLIPRTTGSQDSPTGTLGMRSIGLTWSKEGNYRLYLVLVILFESFEIFKEILVEKKEELLKLLRLLSIKRNRRKLAALFKGTNHDTISDEEGDDEEREAEILESIRRFVRKIDKFFQFLKVFNYLSFLYQGQGPTLVHSLAGIKMHPVSPTPSGGSSVPAFTSSQLFYESRKIIWYSTIALVSSLSTTVDFDYLKSSSLKLLRVLKNFLYNSLPFLTPLLGQSKDKLLMDSDEDQLNKKALQLKDLSCVKCSKKQSEMPQVLSPCFHILCYLCIPVDSLTSKSFNCPRCSASVASFQSWNLTTHCPDPVFESSLLTSGHSNS